MAFCIPRAQIAALKQAFTADKVTPEALLDMDSAGRHAFFAKHVGDDMAKEMNALFESKTLLKDQQRGMVSWAKKVGNVSPQARADFIEKVNKLERVLNPAEEREFLADLAAQKLGATVTVQEAKDISQGAKTVSDLAAGYDPKTGKWSSEEARLRYGDAMAGYQEYIGELLAQANKPSLKDLASNPLSKGIPTAAGATKGIVASLDLSASLRQGKNMAMTHPITWSRAFKTSLRATGQTLIGKDGMRAIKADVLSRPNAMNGKYKAGKFAVGLKFEEAMPSNLPERIPGFGRLYKASEVAYNGMMLKLRADYADMMITKAEEFGVDMADAKQAQGIGKLVNSMTGRGDIGRLEQFGDSINAVFFSLRYLKSNLDVLTMHRGGAQIEEGPARSFVRREAATNLAKIVGTTALILFTAEQLWPGSTEPDTRSSDSSKIKIGNTRFDISGGMGSIITLASRVALGSSKSTMTGRVTDLTTGKFGQKDPWTLLHDFADGKLSPFAGLLRDIVRRADSQGVPLTPSGIAKGLTIPMGVQTSIEAYQDPNAAPMLAVILLDVFGVGANTYGPGSSKKAKMEAHKERRALGLE